MINDNELEYLLALGKVLEAGEKRDDRTGVGTRAVFGLRMEFDLTVSFPLLTTKRVHFKSVVEELLWMLRGQTNVNDLDATIWDEWADTEGNLGPVYGKQWRAWQGEQGHIDQIAEVIFSLRENPTSRRHIVNAWNVGQLDRMALPPCHMAFQFYVTTGGQLDCQLYQRSADMFLGVPFNIASYALLIHIVAHYAGLRPGRLIWVGGDCHIYDNHVEAVKEQLDRDIPGALPQLALRIPEGVAFDELTREHILLADYEPLAAIKAEVAV